MEFDDSRANPSGRMIAIGDIHGCSDALRRLIQEIDPQPADTIVTLGDYIDRGPDSRGVVEQILTLGDRCELVHLLGNHELMLLIALQHPAQQAWWESVGGAATVQSYRDAINAGVENEVSANNRADRAQAREASESDLRSALELIPTRHLEFYNSCSLAYETDTHIFVHANYQADQPIAEQNEEILLWQHLTPNQLPQPHVSGKQIIVGHTPQVHGEILDLGHVICIDTFCFGDGWLTALEVNTGQVWQVSKGGQLREDSHGDKA